MNCLSMRPDEFIWRLFRNDEFDVAETSLSSYTIARTKNRKLTAIPIFPYRRLRSGYIFCKSDSQMKSASDLRGRRMGLLQYQITASVFMRGFLSHEFGVKPEEIIWRTQRSEPVPFTPPPKIDIKQISEEKSLDKMLLDGDVDAFFSPGTPASIIMDGAKIRRLFPDSKRMEVEYLHKTNIFPIMHTVVMKEEIVAENPWLPYSLFKAFVQAKKYFIDVNLDPENYSFPMMGYLLEEQKQLFGNDPYPYGIKENLHVLNTFLDYSYEQGLIDRKQVLNELFSTSTIDT